MDSADQAVGEKRVGEMIFEPLEALGLGRPTTLTKAGYAEMRRKVCQVLAGEHPDVLADLRAWIEAHPTGPNRDRFPIGVHILARAKEIGGGPRDNGPSPLMRSLFVSRLGRDALDDGWAPELLAWVRSCPTGERRWPGSYTVTQIKDKAHQEIRRLEQIEVELPRGDEISDEDREFRDRRLIKLRECQSIREDGLKEDRA